MLATFTPFNASQQMEIYERILGHRANGLDIPKHFTAEVEGICNKLLQPKKTKRLGNMVGGVGGVQAHSWFETQCVSFPRVRAGTAAAPFVPPAKDLDATGTFPPMSDGENVPPDDCSRWDPKF